MFRKVDGGLSVANRSLISGLIAYLGSVSIFSTTAGSQCGDKAPEDLLCNIEEALWHDNTDMALIGSPVCSKTIIIIGFGTKCPLKLGAR